MCKDINKYKLVDIFVGLSGGSYALGNELEHPILCTIDDTKPDGSKPAIIGYVHGNPQHFIFKIL